MNFGFNFKPISFHSEAFTIKLTPRSVRSTKTVENNKIKKIPPLKSSEKNNDLFEEEFGAKDDFNEIKTLRESKRYLNNSNSQYLFAQIRRIFYLFLN